jgi:hypothetical protein
MLQCIMEVSVLQDWLSVTFVSSLQLVVCRGALVDLVSLAIATRVRTKCFHMVIAFALSVGYPMGTVRAKINALAMGNP